MMPAEPQEAGAAAPVSAADRHLAAEPAASDRVMWVLAVSGALGFWIGISAFPIWQVAVETAQVVAGLVRYPPDNPFYLYHTKLWTVLHQVGAVLLRAGVSEITLSKIFSGALVMLSLQALAIVVYALSRRAAIAVAAAVVIFVSRATDFGVAYPITLAGTVHTYGVIGLSFVVLAAGLLGAGRYRLGGFLLGFAPAIHAAQGLWVCVVVAIALATHIDVWRRPLPTLRLAFNPPGPPRQALVGFIGGAALTLVSLALHAALTWDVPAVDPTLVRPYFSTFVTFWDGHRMPAEFPRPGVRVTAGAMILALTWLAIFKRDLPRPSLFLLRFAVAGAILGLAAIPLSWVPPDRLPMTLVILMPLRILNIDVMVFPALLLGMIGAYHRETWGLVLTVFLFAALILNEISMIWEALPSDTGLAMLKGAGPLRPMALATLLLLVGATASRWIVRRAGASSSATSARSTWPATLHVLALVLAGSAGAYTTLIFRGHAFEFEDRTNTPFFEQLAAGRGVLLTGGDLYLVQLRTRRPVLLNGGALDTVVYTPESVPAANRILLDVYGIDLLKPPTDARGGGIIPPETNRGNWERYSLERWQAIGTVYDVADVLTPGDWELAIPLIAADHGLRLYRIPDR
jgi:hypothetical protein